MIHSIIEFVKQYWSTLLAVYAAVLSSWNAWHTWRKERSRFRIKVLKPPSYKDDPVTVIAFYKGGPPIRVTKCRARVLRVRDYEAVEVFPTQQSDTLLTSEHREVAFRLESKFLPHIWYVQVFAEAGIKRTRLLGFLPPLLVEEMKLGLIFANQYGAVPRKGALEESLKDLAKAAKKERREHNSNRE